MAAAFQALSHQTQDHKEAVSAFLAKRPAVFKG
jgi:enoyl-CoA hydratase/carnithine racemase